MAPPDLTNLVGAFEVNINGHFAITVKSLNTTERLNVTQHYGPYGAIGQSKGTGAAIEVSMRFSIPKAGLEFDFKRELVGGKSFLLARGLQSTVRLRFEGVTFTGQSLSSDAERGAPEMTVTASAGSVQ